MMKAETANFKHLLSETAQWVTESEFVSSNGEVSKATGQSEIIKNEESIENNSWVLLGETKRINNYKITVITDNEYQFESLNPELGIQRGTFHIDRNIIYSKFVIEGTNLNGFEVIKRIEGTCYANGALYDGQKLINTWNAIMKQIE